MRTQKESNVERNKTRKKFMLLEFRTEAGLAQQIHSRDINRKETPCTVFSTALGRGKRVHTDFFASQSRAKSTAAMQYRTNCQALLALKKKQQSSQRHTDHTERDRTKLFSACNNNVQRCNKNKGPKERKRNAAFLSAARKGKPQKTL